MFVRDVSYGEEDYRKITFGNAALQVTCSDFGATMTSVLFDGTEMTLNLNATISRASTTATVAPSDSTTASGRTLFWTTVFAFQLTETPPLSEKRFFWGCKLVH